MGMVCAQVLVPTRGREGRRWATVHKDVSSPCTQKQEGRCEEHCVAFLSSPKLLKKCKVLLEKRTDLQ